MNIAKKTEHLNVYVDKLIKLKNLITGNLVAIGGILCEIKDTGIYKEQFETLEEFLGSPEVSFSRTTAFKAMRIYEIFVKKFSMLDLIVEIDPDKLYRISAVVNDKNVVEWLEKAKGLSRSDLNFEVNRLHGKSDRHLLDPTKPMRNRIIEFLDENDALITRMDFTKQEAFVQLLTAWELFKRQ